MGKTNRDDWAVEDKYNMLVDATNGFLDVLEYYRTYRKINPSKIIPASEIARALAVIDKDLQDDFEKAQEQIEAFDEERGL